MPRWYVWAAVAVYVSSCARVRLAQAPAPAPATPLVAGVSSDQTLRVLYDPAQLPLLTPGLRAAMFSSFDRSGGNDDGFHGTYSSLRLERGDSVIAEMTGPGAITRIWTTHWEQDTDGLLARKDEHIRIYIDGEPTPALDVPLRALFDGSLQRFPRPLAGAGLGGFYSYVPIPYATSCKVVVDGPTVHFYQINYVRFPDATQVVPFSMQPDGQQQLDLDAAIARWKDPLQITREPNVEQLSANVSVQQGEAVVGLEAQAGASLVLGARFEGQLGDGEIEVRGSGDDSAALRLPLSLFFATAADAVPYQSLLMGQKDGAYYNLLPFYSRGEFSYRVVPGPTTQGVLHVYRVPIDEVPAQAARLSAQVYQSIPTLDGRYHPLLHVRGRGQYVGTYLQTQGRIGPPSWLEGDDRWTIDGTLRIHGTGTEDYFNCGWYGVAQRLDRPAGFAAHGFPIFGADAQHMRAAAYRWHLADRVPFETSLDVEIEHGDRNQVRADYRSVAFYYLR